MPSGDVIPSPSNYVILKIKTSDGKTHEYKEANEQQAKTSVEQVNEFGLWSERRYYPVPQILWMEIDLRE